MRALLIFRTRSSSSWTSAASRPCLRTISLWYGQRFSGESLSVCFLVAALDKRLMPKPWRFTSRRAERGSVLLLAFRRFSAICRWLVTIGPGPCLPRSAVPITVARNDSGNLADRAITPSGGTALVSVQLDQVREYSPHGFGATLRLQRWHRR